MTETPRPGDQPLPIPNDGPSMHDLAPEWPCRTIAAITGEEPAP